MPRITLAFLCAAVLALLPACSSAGQDVAGASAASTGSSSSGSSSSDSAASESSSGADTTPPLETSGTESAGAPQGGQGSLIAAKLPTGANLDGDWCLTINFLDSASEVPADMRLVVTDIEFDPKVFEFVGSGCSGSTPVCRVGLVLTESSTDSCLALVKSRSAVVGSRVDVKVKATVDCTGGQVADCVRYQEKLESDKKSADGTFEVPEPNQPETTPTDESPPPSMSDSSSDSGATTSS